MQTMRASISEPDWRVFRELHRIALERLCERILAESRNAMEQPGKSAHDRYLTLFELIQSRNDDVARAFDDFRRSTALLQLGVIHSMGLLTGDELRRFSPEAQETIAFYGPIPGS
jgi:hypothetical protein